MDRILDYLYFLNVQGFKHFFALPPLQTAELTIRGIGVRERMPPCVIDRPRGTGDYLFMLFYDPVAIGAGRGASPQTGETQMIWTPGRAQFYGNRQHPYIHTWIHCAGGYVRSLVRACRLPCNRPFPLPDPAVMERHLLALHSELTNQSRPDVVIVKNLMQNWLRETARLIQAAPPTTPACPLPLLKVRHFIESEYDTAITLTQLAALAHLSVPQLCAEFKKHFKTPPIAYLIRQRMHQAVYFLRDHNLKIADVARKVGYADLFYFSKLFKKYYGASPRAFSNRRAGAKYN